jgi:hypothetical protein
MIDGGMEVQRARSPWLGIDAQVDPVRWARLLRRAHELALQKGASPSILRELVASSWRRATSAAVDPDAVAPKVLEADETARALANHPVSSLLPQIESMLREATEDARYFAVLSDAEGVLLWASGHEKALEIAADPGFLPGHLCSERTVGTNAVGTALALDHPVQIFSAEHFNRRLHGWTCSAAPIHDPESHEPIGVLDISGDFRTGHPHSLSLVSAVALVVENELSRQVARRNERLTAAYLDRVTRGGGERSALVTRTGRVLAASPRGWLGSQVAPPGEASWPPVVDGRTVTAEPVGEAGAQILRQSAGSRIAPKRPALIVEALGRARVRASFGGEPVELTPRHGEIIVLLAMSPRGLSGPELGSRLYGRRFNPVTLRAEMSRLRRFLGTALAQNPYRLDTDVRADFTEVEALLADGDALRAAKRYAGPLLPASKVRTIAAARRRLEASVRSCALASDDAETLYAWARSHAGRRDRTAEARLLRLLDPTDARRGLLSNRV